MLQSKEHSQTQLRSIARLHVAGIKGGFLSLLGEKFLTDLYEVIDTDANSFCMTAQKNGNIIGFVAFTENLGKLFKAVLKAKGMAVLMGIGFRLFKPSVFKRVVQNCLYSGKTEKLGLPRAELLSIVVSTAEQRKGVGEELCKAGFQECRRRGIERVKVLVAADNEAADRLYQKVGFKLSLETDSHGIPSKIYVVDRTSKVAQPRLVS